MLLNKRNDEQRCFYINTYKVESCWPVQTYSRTPTIFCIQYLRYVVPGALYTVLSKLLDRPLQNSAVCSIGTSASLKIAML